MSGTRTDSPDFSTLHVPMDVWSQAFWDAAAERRLVMPRCGECGRFRWPAGPFCPACRSQKVAWVPPGRGRIYSFTLMPAGAEAARIEPGAAVRWHAPALIVFEDAPGVRLVTAIVDSPVADIRIDAAVDVHWLAAENATVPVFKTQ